MSKNNALWGAREVIARRRLVTGVTASVPAYIDADGDGHKEWVADVFIGLQAPTSEGVIENVPIAPIARNLVTDIRQPVLMERSKEGRYTIIDRAKVIPAGADLGQGTGSFVETRHNYAELRVRFIADLDWTLSPYQSDPDEPYQSSEDEPYQEVRAFNAFGRQVAGPPAEVAINAPGLNPPSIVQEIERRMVFELSPYQADENAPYQATPDSPYQTVIRTLVAVVTPTPAPPSTMAESRRSVDEVADVEAPIEFASPVLEP